MSGERKAGDRSRIVNNPRCYLRRVFNERADLPYSSTAEIHICDKLLKKVTLNPDLCGDAERELEKPAREPGVPHPGKYSFVIGSDMDNIAIGKWSGKGSSIRLICQSGMESLLGGRKTYCTIYSFYNHVDPLKMSDCDELYFYF